MVQDGLDNVWFDNSAICEAPPHEAILRTFGPTRLLFALDHPISSMRARSVSIGDGFIWTNEVEPHWERSQFGKPVLVGIENLLALKQACRTLGLVDRDVEEIFGGAGGPAGGSGGSAGEGGRAGRGGFGARAKARSKNAKGRDITHDITVDFLTAARGDRPKAEQEDTASASERTVHSSFLREG
jgi:hypothetical protein